MTDTDAPQADAPPIPTAPGNHDAPIPPAPGDPSAPPAAAPPAPPAPGGHDEPAPPTPGIPSAPPAAAPPDPTASDNHAAPAPPAPGNSDTPPADESSMGGPAPTPAASFEPSALAAGENGAHAMTTGPLNLLHDVEMDITVELGRTTMPIRELLALQPGMVVEIDRAAGAPVDVLVNGHPIASGEVVVIDEEFGIRITEIVTDDQPV